MMSTTFSKFQMLAYAAVLRGESRILPIAVGGKQPLIKWKNTPLDTAVESEWRTQIPQWVENLALSFPDANVAVIAKPNEKLFIDEDASAEFRAGYELWSGEKFPNTYSTSARENRLQSHWLQTDRTRAMGNIMQGGTSADISVRQYNLYVLSEGSLHKNGFDVYKSVAGPEILPMPDKLVDYLELIRVKNEGGEASKETQRDEGGKIPVGSIHAYMLREAGKLRNQGLGSEAIEVALRELVHENCQTPPDGFDDSKIVGMSKSIESFEKGSPELLFNQKPDSPILAEGVKLEPRPVQKGAVYPVFPEWVMAGTSLYENFVAPYCKHNSRIPYFMWVPAMTMLLNYISPKIKIKSMVGSRAAKGAIYTVIIGRYGRTVKSSCVNDARDYFNYMGCLVNHSRDLKSAEGRIVAYTVGSMESLGINMQKSDCKSALLVYDELSNLVGKAGIEQSSLSSHLLTCYEGNTFENGVKSTKESFSIQPPYCLSLIACTTDEKFADQWSKMAGKDTGMDDRFTFILQPETLPEPKVWTPVSFLESSLKTRQLIDRAVNQAEFGFEDLSDPKLLELVQKDNRLAMRAEKWALALAVDLGRTEIDSDCVERAFALVQYEKQVKDYLRAYEAETRESQIQQAVCRALELNKGAMEERDLLRKFNHGKKWGTGLWSQAYTGMFKSGWLRRVGTGKKGDPTTIELMLEAPDEE